MSKPIDQEREAFEAWYLNKYYEGDRQCGMEWLSTEQCGGYRYAEPARAWDIWQARAAVQPAGVAVPEYSDERGSDGKLTYEALAWNRCVDQVRRLNSAPHPVSGEQKAVARVATVPGSDFKSLDFFTPLEDIPNGTHLYTAPPAAQDVAGLVEALEEIADPIKFMRDRLQDGEQLNGVYAIQMAESGNYLREIAKRALAAHRAQQGEQPS